MPRYRIPAVIYVDGPSAETAQRHVSDTLRRVSDTTIVLYEGFITTIQTPLRYDTTVEDFVEFTEDQQGG